GSPSAAPGRIAQEGVRLITDNRWCATFSIAPSACRADRVLQRFCGCWDFSERCGNAPPTFRGGTQLETMVGLGPWSWGGARRWLGELGGVRSMASWRASQSEITRPRARSTMLRRASVLCIGVLFVLFGWFAFDTLTDYRDTVANAEEKTLLTARALAQHAES